MTEGGTTESETVWEASGTLTVLGNEGKRDQVSSRDVWYRVLEKGETHTGEEDVTIGSETETESLRVTGRLLKKRKGGSQFFAFTSTRRMGGSTDEETGTDTVPEVVAEAESEVGIELETEPLRGNKQGTIQRLRESYGQR